MHKYEIVYICIWAKTERLGIAVFEGREGRRERGRGGGREGGKQVSAGS